MARAPARLAPSSKVWLRGFNFDSVTIERSLKEEKPSSGSG
jgi:hypothetical protein